MKLVVDAFVHDVSKKGQELLLALHIVLPPEKRKMFKELTTNKQSHAITKC